MTQTRFNIEVIDAAAKLRADNDILREIAAEVAIEKFVKNLRYNIIKAVSERKTEIWMGCEIGQLKELGVDVDELLTRVDLDDPEYTVIKYDYYNLLIIPKSDVEAFRKMKAKKEKPSFFKRISNFIDLL